MKIIPLLLSLALASIAPAMAAPGPSKPEASQHGRTTHYWLSRDLQRLVFWQPRATQAAAAATGQRM